MINPDGPTCPFCNYSYSTRTEIDDYGSTTAIVPHTRAEQAAIHDLLQAIGMHP